MMCVKRIVVASSLLAAMASCSDGGNTPQPDGAAVACNLALGERYFPLKIGASWTYTVTETGKPTTEKSNTVEALEDVGDRKAGVKAYRLRTTKPDGPTVSWQEDQCPTIVRHREQSFDAQNVMVTDQFFVPSKLRVDESAAHLVVGATWTNSYTEVEVDKVTGQTATKSKDETWKVEAVDESVTVPAGTFSALRVRKTTSGAADKTFWFAKGVGKLKETGEQTEELKAVSGL